MREAKYDLAARERRGRDREKERNMKERETSSLDRKARVLFAIGVNARELKERKISLVRCKKSKRKREEILEKVEK